MSSVSVSGDNVVSCGNAAELLVKNAFAMGSAVVSANLKLVVLRSKVIFESVEVFTVDVLRYC